MSLRYNLIGQRFSKLVIVSFHHLDTRYRSNYWNACCDCGNVTIVSTSALRRRKHPTMSCGCWRYERIIGQPAPNRLLEGNANFNSLFHSYKKTAKQRGIAFELTKEEFKKLTSSDCFYCDVGPQQIHRKRETYGEYLYNGVDRLDSNKSYILANCVPCCKTCNYAKRIMSTEEFKVWVSRVFNHFVKNKP